MSAATTATAKTAKLILPEGKEVILPVIVGTENEPAVDIRNLRQESGGYITLDSGYMNTGSTTSAITYLDGEQGILRYRGYPTSSRPATCSSMVSCPTNNSATRSASN